jgi:hypothetical protein
MGRRRESSSMAVLAVTPCDTPRRAIIRNGHKDELSPLFPYGREGEVFPCDAKDHPGARQMAVSRREGLLRNRDGCWFLMTDQASSVQKSDRRLRATGHDGGTVPRRAEGAVGLGIASDPDQAPERFDRLLVIPTLASWLLVGMGWVTLSRDAAGTKCRGNQARAFGVFFIGPKMLCRLELRVGISTCCSPRCDPRRG